MPEFFNIFGHRSCLLEVKCLNRIQIRNVTSSKKDYYLILGVKRNATQLDIKKAYYERSKLVHPDVTGSQAAFVELKQAYDILRRPADRRVYDEGGRRPKGRIYPYPEHQHVYRTRQGFYGNGSDWKADWGNHFDDLKSAKTVHGEREKRYWKRIIMYTSFGLFAVTLYNLGYYWIILQNAKEVEKLIAKDEIARSFLRQKEFRDRFQDNSEVENFARLLKGDIDIAHARKLEEIREKNEFEIRNPEQWLSAVREPLSARRRERTRSSTSSKDF